MVHAGKKGDQARSGGLLPINSVLFLDEREVVGKYAEAFGAAEHEVSAGFKTVMHGGDDAFLQLRAEINKQVAATDQIEARERGIFSDVLFGENTCLADGLHDLIALVDASKKTFQTSGGQIRDASPRINPRARATHHTLPDDVAEHLTRPRLSPRPHIRLIRPHQSHH